MRIIRWMGVLVIIASLALAITACTPPAPAAPAAEAPAQQPAAAPVKIKVGTNAEYRPFEYVDESGEIVGFDVDLIKELAKRAGYEVELVNTKWDGIFTALAAGEFDVVASACTITRTRSPRSACGRRRSSESVGSRSCTPATPTVAVACACATGAVVTGGAAPVGACGAAKSARRVRTTTSVRRMRTPCWKSTGAPCANGAPGRRSGGIS